MKFWLKLISILAFFTLTCCSSLSDPNEEFKKKYGKEVEQIKLQRILPKQSEQEIKRRIDLLPPSSEEIAQINFKASQGVFPYVDIVKFGQNPPQTYLPNQETYEQRRTNFGNNLPANVFETSYQTGLYPPFTRPGTEFDRILIPARDAYGIATELLQKPYLLTGGRSLQKSVDQIIEQRSAEDVEMSQILIDEQKRLKQKQRMLKTFGPQDEEPDFIDSKKYQPEKIVMQKAEEPKKNQSPASDPTKKAAQK